MSEWNIKKPLGHCYQTEKEFQVGEEYYSALVETEEGLERRDYSGEYWQEHKPEVYCFWKTKMQEPEQKKRIFIDDNMLMSFFERLADEKEQERINFRFVITLILMRKRILKYDSSTQQEQGEMWKLKVRGEDRYVEVLNPELTEEQIEQLSTQIEDILQVDL